MTDEPGRCRWHDRNQHLIRYVLAGFGILIVVMAVMSFALLTTINDQNDAQDAQREKDRAQVAYTAKERARIDAAFRAGQFQSCVRGNDVRAYLRQDAYRNASDPVQRGRVADAKFPIIDCPPYLVGKPGKPLTRAQQVAAIRREYPNYQPR